MLFDSNVNISQRIRAYRVKIRRTTQQKVFFIIHLLQYIDNHKGAPVYLYAKILNFKLWRFAKCGLVFKQMGIMRKRNYNDYDY